MAGDWIKMRADLHDDPAVYKLAEILEVDELHVVGALFCFWAWADKHTVDGCVDGATSRLVDKVSSTPGFCQAMVTVGWLVLNNSGISIPNFERHNGESSKERGLKNARQARWRAGKLVSVDALPSTSPSTKSPTREEKRREEKKEEIDTSPAKLPTRPTCPTNQIVEIYHEVLPELPAVRLMPDKRKKAIAGFWNFVLTTKKNDGTPRATTSDEACAWTRQFFERARDNDFLMGRNKRSDEHAGWACDLDFLMSDKGKSQVIEKTREMA